MTAMNLILLGLDTYLAHSISGTIRPGEWIPIIFGPVAGVLLLVAGLIAISSAASGKSDRLAGMFSQHRRWGVRLVLSSPPGDPDHRSGRTANHCPGADLCPAAAGSINFCIGGSAGHQRSLGRRPGRQRHPAAVWGFTAAHASAQNTRLFLAGRIVYFGNPAFKRPRSCPHEFRKPLAVAADRCRSLCYLLLPSPWARMSGWIAAIC